MKLLLAILLFAGCATQKPQHLSDLKMLHSYEISSTFDVPGSCYIKSESVLTRIPTGDGKVVDVTEGNDNRAIVCGMVYCNYKNTKIENVILGFQCIQALFLLDK